MDINDTFLVKAITAFLVQVVLSGICYCVISAIARMFSSTPRGIYFRRLLFMFIALVIWWVLYPMLTASAFIGNGADPHNAERFASWMAKQLGTEYGVHTIWAWFVVALVDRPKMPPNTALEPTPTAP